MSGWRPCFQLSISCINRALLEPSEAARVKSIMSVTDADVGLKSFGYHEDSETYRAGFDRTETNPSTAVVAALGEVMERDVLDLEPLYEAIDPDALDTLVSRPMEPDGDVVITFKVDDYSVSVYSYGVIAVEETPSNESAPVTDHYARP